MRNISHHILITLFILLFSCSKTNSAEDLSDYVVTIGNQQLHFIERPQEGYVLKMQDNIGSTEDTIRSLKSTGDINIKPIRGLGHQGVYKIEDQYQTGNSRHTIASLRNYPDVEYVLPLFEVEGEIITILPEIVARLRNANDLPQLMDFCDLNECHIIRSVIYTDVEYLLETTQKTPDKIFNVVDKLNKTDFIEWAVPDVALEIVSCGPSEEEGLERIEPNDEYFLQQWHLETIRAPEAWLYTQGDPNIVVAVIDSGFDIEHPDLVDNLWNNPGEIPGNGIDDDGNGFEDDVHGWNFMDSNDSLSGNAHGTWCAGLIAATGNNDLGVTGITWNCKIMPILATYSDDESVSGKSVAEALRYAAANGADVISNSWALIEKYRYIWDLPWTERVKSFSSTTIHSAIKDITKLDGAGRNGKGCVVLFATGNWVEGGSVMYPAKYQEVIAVGAIDKTDVVWPYSGSGPELDIVAPSGNAGWKRGNLWTTDITGINGDNNLDPNILDYTDRMGGTSGSCPIVAGVAALILSIDPNLTNIEVQNILSHSTRDLGPIGWDEHYGYGCVDAYAAVRMTLNPTDFILYVDDDATNDPMPGDPNISDPNENGSVSNPFDSIQEALDRAPSGDTIIVRDGIYTSQGNRDINFKGKTLILRSDNGPENCIIDCESKGRGFIFQNEEGLNSVVKGFTIKDGVANSYGKYYGAGIYNYNSSPSIIDCTFTRNIAKYRGGGMYNNNSNPIIINCTFTENETTSTYTDDGGGGMYNYESSPDVIDCTFTENSANKDDGGGIYNDDSNPTVTNCTFTGNIAYRGGGIYSDKGNHTVVNSVFTGNTADLSGGGMFNNDESQLNVTNCIFAENTANRNGGGMYNNDDSQLAVTNCTFTANQAIAGGVVYNSKSSTIMTNCIVWDNTPNQIYGNAIISYSNIQGDWNGEGNIDVDPRFADAESGDYHLKSEVGRWDPNSQSWIMDDVTSPCIDSGDPNSDFSGETWPHGGRINMGAYGGTREASMSLETGGMFLPRVVYIYSYNAEAAESFDSLLESYGCPTTLIKPADIPAIQQDSYDLIIIANDTQYEYNWSDPNTIAAIEDSNKPVVGLGDGGYDFFGLLGLSIGSPNGGHGTKNSIEVVDPNSSFFSTPYLIEVPQDRALQLYTETNHVGIYYWPTIPENVTAIGREVDDPGYFPLAAQFNRHLLWGFNESPQKMTDIGKKLFVNIVISTANNAWKNDN